MEKKGKHRPVAGKNRKSVEAEEAEWLKKKLDRSGEDSPDVAAAPLGTDQEAAGAISTPSGRRKYSQGDKVIYKSDTESENAP